MPDLATELTTLAGRVAKLQEEVRRLREGNTTAETQISGAEHMSVLLRRRVVEWSGLLRRPMQVRKVMSR